MTDLVSTIPEPELQEMGLSSIVHLGQFDDPDNPTVETVLRGKAPRQDKDGRQIVSYKQYKELSKMGHRLDNYSMLMRWPGSMKTNPVQASKFLKWFGAGYDAVGAPVEETHAFRDLVVEFKEMGLEEDEAKKRALAELGSYGQAVQTSMSTPRPDVVAYYCREKYPDCGRFFDNPRGLMIHQKKDHEGFGKNTPK